MTKISHLKNTLSSALMCFLNKNIFKNIYIVIGAVLVFFLHSTKRVIKQKEKGTLLDQRFPIQHLINLKKSILSWEKNKTLNIITIGA